MGFSQIFTPKFNLGETTIWNLRKPFEKTGEKIAGGFRQVGDFFSGTSRGSTSDLTEAGLVALKANSVEKVIKHDMSHYRAPEVAQAPKFTPIEATASKAKATLPENYRAPEVAQAPKFTPIEATTPKAKATLPENYRAPGQSKTDLLKDNPFNQPGLTDETLFNPQEKLEPLSLEQLAQTSRTPKTDRLIQKIFATPTQPLPGTEFFTNLFKAPKP